jgi:hypothetical protein
MSEPFLERLSRFTPDAGRVDRDALLFATGRASARPNRVWIALVGALMASQALSLVLLWPQAAPPSVGSPVQVARTAPAALEPSVVPSPGSTLAHYRLDLEAEERPETGTFVETGPPLRAYGSPPASILN